ncbi:hypothetical protein niasHS_000584 [Heterodera schachtii]|uniref:Peptidase S26 domain-containing protein n=1 Tax=Heterodera schachtii TaxID=97005 RepID=A0ABD2K4X4_HETSC
MKTAIELAKKVVLGAFIVHVFRQKVGRILTGVGDSMLPTIHDGDIHWARVWDPNDDLRPGDIVCLVDPLDASEYVTKRVFAVHKDCIEVRGDNVKRSLDSRKYGPVPAGLVRYRVSVRLLPLNR